MAMFRVVVQGSRGAANEFVCEAESCRIGKAENNLVVLQGWTVAAHHASIYRQDGRLFVSDASGRGATAVNGERITQPYGPLHSTDEIQIGAWRLTVRDDTPLSIHEDTAAPTIQPVARPQTGGLVVVKPSPAPIDFTALRQLHERLIARMDVRRIDTAAMSEPELRARVQALLQTLLDEDPSLSQGNDRHRLLQAALNEAIGLGPLEELLQRDDVTEIMVNRHDEIFIERAGRLDASPIVFSGPEAVRAVIERIIAPIGRRIDESSPMVDARLKDGSRVNAIIPPIALKGPSITIRKFPKRKLVDQDLIDYGSASQNMMAFLAMAVRERKNILVSGGTGSGKTTLLNILSNHIPAHERIVTIEDAAELKLGQENLVSLEARPGNAEGKGLVTIRDLVRNSLRMRPDRIVVGECRGGEALDMLQAMNTGHDGSLTTVHANTARDALSRLEVMVLMAGMDLPVAAIRQQIAAAIDLIVQQSRFADGSRKITQISEVTGMENGVIQLQDLFIFRRDGFDSQGRIRGAHLPTGRIPEFYEEMVARGVDVDRALFLDPALAQ